MNMQDSDDLERHVANHLVDKSDPSRLSAEDVQSMWGTWTNFMFQYDLQPWDPEDLAMALRLSKKLKKEKQAGKAPVSSSSSGAATQSTFAPPPASTATEVTSARIGLGTTAAASSSASTSRNKEIKKTSTNDSSTAMGDQAIESSSKSKTNKSQQNIVITDTVDCIFRGKLVQPTQGTKIITQNSRINNGHELNDSIIRIDQVPSSKELRKVLMCALAEYDLEPFVDALMYGNYEIIFSFSENPADKIDMSSLWDESLTSFINKYPRVLKPLSKEIELSTDASLSDNPSDTKISMYILQVPWRLKIGDILTVHSLKNRKEFNGKIVRVTTEINWNTQTIGVIEVSLPLENSKPPKQLNVKLGNLRRKSVYVTKVLNYSEISELSGVSIPSILETNYHDFLLNNGHIHLFDQLCEKATRPCLSRLSLHEILKITWALTWREDAAIKILETVSRAYEYIFHAMRKHDDPQLIYMGMKILMNLTSISGLKQPKFVKQERCLLRSILLAFNPKSMESITNTEPFDPWIAVIANLSARHPDTSSMCSMTLTQLFLNPIISNSCKITLLVAITNMIQYKSQQEEEEEEQKSEKIVFPDIEHLVRFALNNPNSEVCQACMKVLASRSTNLLSSSSS